MRRFSWLALSLALVAATASPGAATVATIATTVPLLDHEEQSVSDALQAAVKAAVTGAIAMGLPWVRMNQALVLEDAVAVQILATDTEPEPGTGADEWEPDTEAGTRADPPPEAEL